MHRSEFLKSIKEAFPELAEKINQQKGLLHFEMEEFRKFCQQAIFDKNISRLKKCFSLAEKALMEGNKDLKDSVDVSLIEGLEFTTQSQSYPEAWKIMPDALKKLYVSFHGRLPFPK